jgi:hypothetical protein
MRRILPMVFSAFAVFCSAVAQEQTPRYSLTIYNEQPNSGLPSPFDSADGESNKPGGYAVVRDRRSFDLKPGNNTVQVRDVARWLEPDDLSVRPVGDADGTEIASQRFEDATLSLDALVQHHIGHAVEINTNGATQTTVTGTLLSNVGGLIVQGADGRVTTVTEFTRVTFPDLPKGLSAVPSLRWDIASKKSGAQNFELVYPTTGLAWRASYSGWLATGGDCRLDLSGWAQIANSSGADFHGARVKLIAGEPHRVNRTSAPRSMMMRAPTAHAPVAEETGTVGDYHEYTIDNIADILSGTLLRVALFNQQTVPCTRQYLFEATQLRANVGMAPITDRSYGLSDVASVVSTLAFKADRAFPAGTLRVLENASDGTPEFIGEDKLGHTPRGESVSVQLGSAFDLRGERKQTDYQIDKDKHTATETFAIRLTNAGATAQSAIVREHLYRWSQWNISASSLKYEKRSSDTVDFKVDIPGKGTTSVTYTVQYQWTESLK